MVMLLNKYSSARARAHTQAIAKAHGATTKGPQQLQKLATLDGLRKRSSELNHALDVIEKLSGVRPGPNPQVEPLGALLRGSATKQTRR